MAIKDYSTTAGNNSAAPPNGAPEGWAPSSVNNTVRQVMADIRSWYETAQWIDYGHVPTKVDSDTFTVAGDQTAIYESGRRLKFTGSVSGYATISSSSYSAPNTTVNVTASSWTGTLTAVAVGIISASNNSIPVTNAIKSSSTTKTSDISIANDADLIISSVPVGKYKFDSLIHFWAAGNGANGGIQYKINFSGTASGILTINAYVASATTTVPTDFGYINSHASVTSPISGPHDTVRMSGTLVVTASGTLSIQWAQNSSNTNGTILLGGYLTLEPLK